MMMTTNLNKEEADVNMNGQIPMMPESPDCLSNTSDDEDNCESPTGSAYEEGPNLMSVAMEDEVTAQLAAAGPVGVAAAAAIVSSKKRKRPHSFETNPSIRKRQQNRLLRKLRQTIDEFATRVGQQAVVLVAAPSKPNNTYKVFGAKPLEDIIRSLRSMVMENLDDALAHQAPPPVQDDPGLFELPPLIIDGIPTSVEKMTQAQLRAFIPLMLKYSTGRGKPGWGRGSTRPPWWPKDLPWANVRMDARSEEEKSKVSWTHALRQIVINCYKYHGREDLLPAFNEENDKPNVNSSNGMHGGPTIKVDPVEKMQIEANTTTEIITSMPDNISEVSEQVTLESSTYNTDIDLMTQYTPTILHSITNSDGSVSFLQVDPNNPIITLPDGTTAHVQGVATLQSGQEDGETTIHTIHTIAEDGTQAEVVDLNSVAEATLNSEGQIILTGEDGHVSGVISVPVSGSMYQTMVANLHANGDGTVCMTPLVHLTKGEQCIKEDADTVTVNSGNITAHSMVIQSSSAEHPQVLQVLQLKNASVFTKALSDIKTEESLLIQQ